MRRFFAIVIVVLFGAAPFVGGAASGAEMRVSRYAGATVVGPHLPVWRYNRPNPPPFTRGARAQAVWDSGACWSECGSYCAWAMNGCLYEDTQGVCLSYTDACDRYCQRKCRTYTAGPFLPVE
jgi:hypothetical protein